MVRHLAMQDWEFDVITLARVEAGFSVRNPSDRPIDDVEVFPVGAAVWPDTVVGGLAVVTRQVRKVVRTLREGRVGASKTGRVPTGGTLDAAEVWRPGSHETVSQRIGRAVDGLRELLADRAWSVRAVQMADTLLRTRRYGCVVVSSPPHVSLLAGARIGLRAGIPFVADMRDPWVLGLDEVEPYLNDVARLAGRIYERRVHRAASVLVHNTQRALERIRPELPRRSPPTQWCVPNGYDRLDQVGTPDPDCFRVVFAGWLHGYMDVRVLLRACARLRDRNGLTPNQFLLEFIGSSERFGGVAVMSLAEAVGLAGHVVMHPRVPRKRALELQARAAALVAFDYPHRLAVVMKFYDYAQMRGSLLLIGNVEGALADAAGRVGVKVHDPSDEAAIDATLDQAYARWVDRDYVRVNDSYGVFDRTHRSAEMHRVLRDVVEGAGLANAAARGGQGQGLTSVRSAGTL